MIINITMTTTMHNPTNTQITVHAGHAEVNGGEPAEEATVVVPPQDPHHVLVLLAGVEAGQVPSQPLALAASPQSRDVAGVRLHQLVAAPPDGEPAPGPAGPAGVLVLSPRALPPQVAGQVRLEGGPGSAGAVPQSAG